MKKFIISLILLSSQPLLGVEKPLVEQAQVVILGSGVGALTSAIYLGRSGIKPIVIEGKNPGGALAQSHSVQNWPGELDINGADLTDKMREQALKSGAEFRKEETSRLDLSSSPFRVYTRDILDKEASHEIEARAVIIAMGSIPKMLGVPGESSYFNKGVYTCALCDGPLFKDKIVGVVGGSDGAITEAHYLSRIAKKVHLFVRGTTLRSVDALRLKEVLSTKNIEVHYRSTVEKIDGNGENLTKVTLKTEQKKEEIPLNALFLAIGATPNTALIKGQVELTDQGYIVLKDKQETSVKGVFAVGDITNSICKQAVCAAGDGALATLQAEKYLSNQKESLPILKTALTTPSKQGDVIEITSEEQFNKELSKHEQPVVVDFYAPWCQPCKQLSPQLNHWAQELSGKAIFLKVNVETLPKLASSYKVHAMPTVILFSSQGVMVDRKVGTEEIYQWMQQAKKKGSFNQ